MRSRSCPPARPDRQHAGPAHWRQSGAVVGEVSPVLRAGSALRLSSSPTSSLGAAVGFPLVYGSSPADSHRPGCSRCRYRASVANSSSFGSGRVCLPDSDRSVPPPAHRRKPLCDETGVGSNEFAADGLHVPDCADDRQRGEVAVVRLAGRECAGEDVRRACARKLRRAIDAFQQRIGCVSKSAYRRWRRPRRGGNHPGLTAGDGRR